MSVELLLAPLYESDIEFRIQSINKGGFATIWAYKNARVDQNRLDEVIGAMNWKREHSDNNKNCTVSIWCREKNQWVGKEDTGTESYTDSEKGLASDSFKRACTNWGIGRGLYRFPDISVKLNDNEVIMPKEGTRDKPKATWNLKLKDWRWSIEYLSEGRVKKIVAQDTNGVVRFQYHIGSVDVAQLLERAVDNDNRSEVDDIISMLKSNAELKRGVWKMIKNATKDYFSKSIDKEVTQ